MSFLELAVCFIYRLDQLGEAGRFVDRPEPREAMAQQFYLALGEQSDGDDAFLRQAGAPN